MRGSAYIPPGHGNLLETRYRSILKTISWRVLATLITAGVAWVITDSFQYAAIIGTMDCLIKFFAYYAHERIWNQIDHGRKEPAH